MKTNNIMIESLLNHYKQKFHFEKFYDNLLYNISTYPENHIDSKTFLLGYKPMISVTHDIPNIITNSGDNRVDLPVWFGDPNSKNKLVIIGLEPRDTDESGRLNIDRVGNNVFATPFALERPRGPYYSAFKDLMNNGHSFVFFTDVVKAYAVIEKGNKKINDEYARQSFQKNAADGKSFLLNELEIINPSKIIALGNKSFDFIKKLLKDKYEIEKIEKVRHPSYGGAIKARQKLSAILEKMK